MELSAKYEPGQHPAVVLKSHVLLEAYLRLYARDAAQRSVATSAMVHG